MANGQSPIPVIQRIERYLNRQSEADCWIFTGHRNKKGYGLIKVGGKYGASMLVHRVVYEHFYGAIQDGLFICHRCDNPSCCNPDHLYQGTHQDNMNDMKDRGRQYITYGSRSAHCKLSSEQIVAIRNDHRSLRKIAEEYGVTKSNISMIKNFRSRRYDGSTASVQ